MKRFTVFVDGQDGTTGLKIFDYLLHRQDLEVLTIDPDKRKDCAARTALLNEADIVFLCLPDDAAKEAVSWVRNANTCVIDASTAHRTHSEWTYGLPELSLQHRRLIASSKRIANPGCHATAFISLIAPLINAQCLRTDSPITATSITGFSGGGKKMIEQYLAAGKAQFQGDHQALLATRPYALGLSHKHLPEMMQQTGLQCRPLFVPTVGPFRQGLALSIPMHLSNFGSGCSAAKLHDVLVKHYANEPFVRVKPINDPATLEAGFLDVQATVGSNFIDIFLFVNESTPPGEILLVARLDNLGKGASGAAIQSMNIHLGLAQSTGL